jgi:glycosyltransferase involved in cell wall biosynthesis
MSPRVSVIVATYNYGRFLAGALDSALRQTLPDFELFVIDDGSTDGTEAVAAPYLADRRVQYHRTDHLGQPGAKNTGIRLSTAPLIAFLDADDAWLPTKLERQVALFERDPAVGVTYTRRRVMDEEGHELEHREPPLYRGDVLAALLRDNFVCFSSCMVRRGVFEDVGLFDEKLPLAIDYDLWLRVARRYRFDYVDEPLVRYRVGHGNLSSRVEERLRTALAIVRRHTAAEARLPRSLVRAKVATVYSDLALVVRERSRLGALPCYARALLNRPGHAAAWVGLGSLLLPEQGRRLLRRALGKPVDWRVRARVSLSPLAPEAGARGERKSGG